jgi:tRNA(adenine34) deaminase
LLIAHPPTGSLTLTSVNDFGSAIIIDGSVGSLGGESTTRMLADLEAAPEPMTDPNKDVIDRRMMTRAIALSRASGEAGEYPYGAVICRNGAVVAESINRVTHERDVTRHAEVVAISKAHKALGAVGLEDCEIYVNAEPCAACSYAIRESRIRRVVYALDSPHMGGLSKWNVLRDLDLCRTMPDVFAPPPEIVSGYMADEAERALTAWSPLIATVIRHRGLLAAAPAPVTRTAPDCPVQPQGIRRRLFRLLRRNLFDRFGQR